MKFTVSTKPLINSLNLCIINANINDYYRVSLVVQITANADTLYINHAATSILSEVRLKGLGEGEETSIMVDSKLFKQLVSTFTTPQVVLEFTDNALILNAGKSSFSLPKMLDTSEAQIPTPSSIIEEDSASANDITKSEWKFIKKYQMYAIGNSDSNPIYNYVWIGENGDVLVSDYVNSLFTHSNVSKLGKNCLLTDTIVNLFNSLPDGAKLITHEDTYSICVSTDSYEYISEVTPMYESDKIGNYNSEIIIGMMNVDEVNTTKVNVGDINTVLNQAALLSSRDITCTVEENQITFKDTGINCTIPTEGGPDTPYTLIFKPAALKSVILNCPESTICISPTTNGDEVVGVTISSGGLTVVLAGVE